MDLYNERHNYFITFEWVEMNTTYGFPAKHTSGYDFYGYHDELVEEIKKTNSEGYTVVDALLMDKDEDETEAEEIEDEKAERCSRAAACYTVEQYVEWYATVYGHDEDIYDPAGPVDCEGEEETEEETEEDEDEVGAYVVTWCNEEGNEEESGLFVFLWQAKEEAAALREKYDCVEIWDHDEHARRVPVK